MDDVEAKSLELKTTKKEIDEKSKVVVDLKAMPTLSTNDVKELERHEQVMLEMQASVNPDT